MASYTTNPGTVNANVNFNLTWTDQQLGANGSYTLNFKINNTIMYTITRALSVTGNSITFTDVKIDAIGNYTVSVSGSLYNGTALSLLSVTCFVEGTEILCVFDNKEEYIKVEDLTENMILQTYLHGPKNIFGISKRQYKNDKTISQICKLSGCPGQTKDLFLTGGHSILVDELTESQIEDMRPYNTLERPIDDKKLLLCCINENAEKIDDDKVYNIYHIILENDNIMGQYGIYANGILAESMSIDVYNKLRQTLYVGENIF